MILLERVLVLLAFAASALFLVTLAVGPARSWRLVCRAWAWLTERKHEPTEVLNRVVREHERAIRQLKDVLSQSEAAHAEIVRNMRKSEDIILTLQREARGLAAEDDDLGAKAALYKINLERLALAGFREQLEQQRQRIDQARRRLHLLELQLRQYEVGRTILLAQLAEAKTVEQQYAVASQFDPFSAVAAWNRAEGSVHEAAQSARAVEQVHLDTADLPLTGQPVRIDPETLDRQLAELKEQVRRGGIPSRN
jgi:phage shock protein A